MQLPRFDMLELFEVGFDIILQSALDSKYRNSWHPSIQSDHPKWLHLVESFELLLNADNDVGGKMPKATITADLPLSYIPTAVRFI